MATDRVPLQESQDNTPEAGPQDHEVWEGLMNHMDYPDYHRMADFYDVQHEDRRDDFLAEKISYLTEWAKETTKSDDRLQHQEIIKNLIKDLGYSMKGKELVTKLHKWARLDLDKQRIKKEMELLNEHGV